MIPILLELNFREKRCKKETIINENNGVDFIILKKYNIHYICRYLQ